MLQRQVFATLQEVGQSDCPMQPGLWAVEPHVARDTTGAKFEEILVVTGERAYSLDDDLSHCRRWSGSEDQPEGCA